MSKEAASADLQAAAYWRNVARSDRSEINVAVTKVSELTTAAKREEKARRGAAPREGFERRLILPFDPDGAT